MNIGFRYQLGPPDPTHGIIGSMAWSLVRGRLQIVWFRLTEDMHNDIAAGRPLVRKQFTSYAEARGLRAERARENRRASRQPA